MNNQERDVTRDTATSENGAGTAETKNTVNNEVVNEQLQQVQNRYRQLLADFENYRRNVERERITWARSAVRGCVLDILELVDDFERARKDIAARGSDVEGFELLYRAFLKLITKYNVTEVAATGQFDPAIHEAIAQVDVPGAAAGDIVEVIKKGYYHQGELLRPAQVVVARERIEIPDEM